MSGEATYQPPYTITSEILTRVARISEAMGRLNVLTDRTRELRLRRITRIRTIRGSLAIEGNRLNEAQITAILDGKRVIAPPRADQEARNALAAYDHFESWRPEVEKDLLDAVTTTAPQVTSQVGELVPALQGEMSRETLQATLSMQDRKSFRERYIRSARADGLK